MHNKGMEMIMNKTSLRILLIGSGVVVIGIVLILAFTLFSPKEPTSPAAESTAASSGYLLKEYDGRIALYALPETTPRQIFNIYVDSLPDADIARLQSGIPADTLEQAEEYLEDFDS